MNADFCLLVDFLRGELDSGQAALVRARLEADDAFFAQFERLRRVYAVLRSMPVIKGTSAPAGEVETIPLTEPRAAFVADVRREYQLRGLASLIPHIAATPVFVRALRVEFCVRAVCASLPQIALGASFLDALRAEFGARARVDSLPFIVARPAWIRALREGFCLRATVCSIPMLEPRAEFVARLREEFAQRALVASMPAMEVRAGFARKLKVALVEAQRDTAPEPVAAAALPAVEARDPFRRRLFRDIKLSSRRSVRETPRRVDLDEYEWGRQLRGTFKTSRRAVAFTFAVHVLAIVILLFVFIRNDISAYNPLVAIGESEFSVTPELPGAGDEFVPGRYGERVSLPAPYSDDWSSSGADMPIGLGGDSEPDRQWRTQDDELPPTPRRTIDREEPLAFMDKESASSFFRLRGSSRQQKIDYLGSEDLYEALDKSLAWLARAQQLNPANDGSWGWVNVDSRMISQFSDLREVQQLEMTSAALLAFLGDGHSSEKSPLPAYSYAVDRGIKWILSKQRSSGQIGPEGQKNVLIHAMATLALAEEFGLTRAQRLREPLRQACRWLCDVRAAGTAGFPFHLEEAANMSTSVWAYMALATARNVQVPPIDLPQVRLDDFLAWYRSEADGVTVMKEDVVLGHELLAESAAGAMAQFAEGDDDSEKRPALLSKISREMPDLEAPGKRDRDNGDVRYLFFGSQAQALNMQRTGGKSSEWYNTFAHTLLKNQRDDGTWACTSDYSALYGDVYTVAMACLSIENAYRVSIIK